MCVEPFDDCFADVRERMEVAIKQQPSANSTQYCRSPPYKVLIWKRGPKSKIGREIDPPSTDKPPIVVAPVYLQDRRVELVDDPVALLLDPFRLHRVQVLGPHCVHTQRDSSHLVWVDYEAVYLARPIVPCAVGKELHRTSALDRCLNHCEVGWQQVEIDLPSHWHESSCEPGCSPRPLLGDQESASHHPAHRGRSDWISRA